MVKRIVQLKRQASTRATAAKRMPRASMKGAASSRQQIGSAVVSNFRASKPRIQSTASGGIIVEHTEFLGNVVSDADNQFAYDVYELNFDNSVTFPWGSQIATLYETQELLDLEVIYRPMCATGISGAVEIGIDYDASDDVDDVTEQDLLNWESSVETNVWNPLVHRSTPENLRKFSRQRYTNDDGESDRFSSFGNLFVATTTSNLPVTQGVTGYQTVVFGHVYLRYRVKLETPQLTSSSITKGLRATVPQQLLKYTTTAAIGSTSNAFAGVDPTSAPTVTTLEAPTSVRIVTAGANQYLQDGQNATYASAGTPLLVFDRDFEGTMSFTMSTLSTLLNTNPAFVDQFCLTNNGTNGSSRPQLKNNVFSPVDTIASTSSGIYGFVAYVIAAAGTAWRLAAPLYSAAIGINKVLALNSARRRGSKLADAALSSYDNRINFDGRFTNPAPAAPKSICLT